MNSIASEIQELERSCQLDSHEPDVGRFVATLITLLRRCGRITAKATGDRSATFLAGDGSEASIHFTRSNYVIRMICARLGTFACEHGASHFSPHGGEYDVCVPDGSGDKFDIHIFYVNTLHEHSFEIYQNS